MSSQYKTIQWKEVMDSFTIDCTLDIAIDPLQSGMIFLTIPGVDGSVDGYENKYKNIADTIRNKHSVATVRMANPFIASSLWESNVREALSYIEANAIEIAGSNEVKIAILAYSVGAAIIAQIAWEYPAIKSILLINPASKLDSDNLQLGLAKITDKKVSILVGSKDPYLQRALDLKSKGFSVDIIEGADHYFRNEYSEFFNQAADKYLFNK